MSTYAESASIVRGALRKEYRDGIAHGFETTLRLLLGEEVDGAPPFTGPLTPECEAWARDSLARLTEAGS